MQPGLSCQLSSCEVIKKPSQVEQRCSQFGFSVQRPRDRASRVALEKTSNYGPSTALVWPANWEVWYPKAQGAGSARLVFSLSQIIQCCFLSLTSKAMGLVQRRGGGCHAAWDASVWFLDMHAAIATLSHLAALAPWTVLFSFVHKSMWPGHISIWNYITYKLHTVMQCIYLSYKISLMYISKYL